MALHGNIPAPVWVTDLVEVSKDAASLLVCTQKKFFPWGMRVFCEWRHKWRTFRPPWPTLPGPGRQPIGGSISILISGNHACRDCVWHIILVAELNTTCLGERMLVPTRFNVTFLPLRLCCENTHTCFLKGAENLTTYGYILWRSQIVCIRPILWTL